MLIIVVNKYIPMISVPDLAMLTKLYFSQHKQAYARHESFTQTCDYISRKDYNAIFTNISIQGWDHPRSQTRFTLFSYCHITLLTMLALLSQLTLIILLSLFTQWHVCLHILLYGQSASKISHIMGFGSFLLQQCICEGMGRIKTLLKTITTTTTQH